MSSADQQYLTNAVGDDGSYRSDGTKERGMTASLAPKRSNGLKLGSFGAARGTVAVGGG